MEVVVPISISVGQAGQLFSEQVEMVGGVGVTGDVGQVGVGGQVGVCGAGTAGHVGGGGAVGHVGVGGHVAVGVVDAGVVVVVAP